MTTTPDFQSKFAEERLRQARQTFNVAIAICVVATVCGIGLVYSGKTAIGIVTGVAGVVPISRCIQFYREANDRLDELMDESIDDDKKKEPDDDDEENAPA